MLGCRAHAKFQILTRAIAAFPTTQPSCCSWTPHRNRSTADGLTALPDISHLRFFAQAGVFFPPAVKP